MFGVCESCGWRLVADGVVDGGWWWLPTVGGGHSRRWWCWLQQAMGMGEGEERVCLIF